MSLVSKSETLSNYNHTTVMASQSRGKHKLLVVGRVNKKRYNIICYFHNSIFNWEVQCLPAGYYCNVAGGKQRKEVSVVGQNVEIANFIFSRYRFGRAFVKSLRWRNNFYVQLRRGGCFCHVKSRFLRARAGFVRV